jgi:hypothetical protein
MNVTGERFHPPEHEPAPRYCGACGEIFAEPAERCPNCAERWPFSTHLQVQPLATMLTEFRGLHDAPPHTDRPTGACPGDGRHCRRAGAAASRAFGSTTGTVAPSSW